LKQQTTKEIRMKTTTFTELTYKQAVAAMEEFLETMPNAWSMHPYCGGLINAMAAVHVISEKTANKLWKRFAQGI
jgi:hypothetical protein